MKILPLPIITQHGWRIYAHALIKVRMTTSSFLTRKIMNSRSVSFVDRLELEFSGNHFCHALTLGDIDGDGVSG